MKLLFCPKCWDLFKLTFETRSCKCGEVVGKYLDNTVAEVNGKGISLGIDNFTLPTQDVSGIVKITCYARPHTGRYNPNTMINKDLDADKDKVRKSKRTRPTKRSL